MGQMATQESQDQTGTPRTSDIGKAIADAISALRQGAMTPETLLRIASSRQSETLQYCVQRLADPSLRVSEEVVIAKLLQETGMVAQFIESLLSVAPEDARMMVGRFQNSDRGFDMKLAVYLQSNDPNVVIRCLELLSTIGENKQLVPLLFALLEHKEARIRSKAALVIQKFDTELTFSGMLMRHKDAQVRANALQTLIERSDPRVLEFLRMGAADPDGRVRTLAAVGLAGTGHPLGMVILSQMIRHRNPADRRSAAWGLGTCNSSDALRLLETAASDPDQEVREISNAGLLALRERSARV